MKRNQGNNHFIIGSKNICAINATEFFCRQTYNSSWICNPTMADNIFFEIHILFIHNLLVPISVKRLLINPFSITIQYLHLRLRAVAFGNHFYSRSFIRNRDRFITSPILLVLFDQLGHCSSLLYP
jgi:hypothetical protein